MNKTLIAIDDTTLLYELQTLEIWGERTGFELTAICRSPEDALAAAKKTRFDLVITGFWSSGADKFINSVRKNISANIIMLGRELSLDDARLCIKTGVSDYFVLPLEKAEFIKTFEEIKRASLSYRDDIGAYAEELTRLLNGRDPSFAAKAEETADIFYTLEKGGTDKAAAELLQLIAEDVFDKNEWLDLYMNKEDISAEIESVGGKQRFITSLVNFYNELCELYPLVNNDRILRVILYILNNPESDLKQKSIAAALYMNSSYLSTVFTANTQQRFVDYLTNVKLHRAAWLLRNTTLKVTDICERLDYKDMGYFSRLFKKKYGITPSDYRVPDHYEYFI